MAIDTTSLIGDRVSAERCKNAVSALLGHVRKVQKKADETELLPGKEQHVWLVMTVKRMQPMKNLKPQRIAIEHPLVDPRTTSVCLITKDPQREYKDLLESHNIKFISRVVGIEKLKGKFKGFDARRLLLRENGLFLADKRVIPLLPQLLGKEWFKAKKQPIPVTLTKKDLKSELEKAISSTYMHQNKGTCTSIKIATISHKDSQVVSNLKAAIPAVVARIHGGWDNVQSFNIKTSSSISLPIWTCPLGSDEPGSRWEGMTVDESEWGGLGDDGSDEVGQKMDKTEPAKIQEASPQVNGKKRTANSEEVEVGQKMDQTEPAKIQEASPQVNGKKRTANSEEVESGVRKKKIKKSSTSIASDVTSPKQSSVAEAEKQSSNKSRELVDADEILSNISSPKDSIVHRTSPPISEPLSADHPTKKKKRQTASETHSTKPVSPAKSVPDRVNSKETLEGTISRKEMKQKKVTLSEPKMEKKKEKLRETEKSARKGVKAQIVGKLKA